ncbi:hypothetical protein OKA04_13525 [Luteolibacter flavescens]|uniref:Glycine zipper 2TM domain-containing protein n=1 Tax=Luteolibacter flavescens TaxID=1859460 RepID=A0ABT3FQB6_9BACT|nr:hypothetical protein [Luteolibacter flavescens]MCW1885755.1 hypothetical protein [Luteolibacter flavescens]
MKAIPLKVSALVIALAGTSCMTTYDAYGRPVQSVDPGAAAAIAIGAAAVGYAIGENNGHHHHYHGGHYYYSRPYVGGPVCW